MSELLSAEERARLWESCIQFVGSISYAAYDMLVMLRADHEALAASTPASEDTRGPGYGREHALQDLNEVYNAATILDQAAEDAGYAVARLRAFLNSEDTREREALLEAAVDFLAQHLERIGVMVYGDVHGECSYGVPMNRDAEKRNAAWWKAQALASLSTDTPEVCPTCGWRRDYCGPVPSGHSYTTCPDCGHMRPVYHADEGTSGFIPPDGGSR